MEVCLFSVVCGASYENLYSDIPKEGEEKGGMEEEDDIAIFFKISLKYFLFNYIFVFYKNILLRGQFFLTADF